MAEDTYVIPSPGDDNFVNLSRQQSGRLKRKQIFKMNTEFVHPSSPETKIKVDETLAKSLVHNFYNSGNIVQVPMVNDANQHVEGPDKNLGEVIDLDYDEKGIYATIDARKCAEDFGKTLLGASAFMHLNYKNTETGEPIGPTLLHVAVTNRPYLTNLEDYTDVMSLSADTKGEAPVLLELKEQTPPETQPSAELPINEDKETPMTLEEMLTKLKADHGIDVPALQAAATQVTELSNSLSEVQNELKLSGENAVSIETVGKALVELSAANDSLASEVTSLKADRDQLKADSDALKLSAAETEIDGLIKAGRVLPKQKDVMVKLSMTDRETFEALLPESPVVKLSESGYTVHEEPARASDETLSRYKDMATRIGAKAKTR